MSLQSKGMRRRCSARARLSGREEAYGFTCRGTGIHQGWRERQGSTAVRMTRGDSCSDNLGTHRCRGRHRRKHGDQTERNCSYCHGPSKHGTTPCQLDRPIGTFGCLASNETLGKWASGRQCPPPPPGFGWVGGGTGTFRPSAVARAERSPCSAIAAFLVTLPFCTPLAIVVAAR